MQIALWCLGGPLVIAAALRVRSLYWPSAYLPGGTRYLAEPLRRRFASPEQTLRRSRLEPGKRWSPGVFFLAQHQKVISALQFQKDAGIGVSRLLSARRRLPSHARGRIRSNTR